MNLKQNIVEEILLNLPVKSLLRFKLVSKAWRLKIISQPFKQKHLQYQLSKKPDILIVADQDDYDEFLPNEELMLRTMVFGGDRDLDLLLEQDAVSLQIPYEEVSKSIDGLICIYDFRGSIYMSNPTIQWLRQVPQATIQEYVNENCDEENDCGLNLLGFGKDKSLGIYKLVWLYNDLLESDVEGASTCEVFDFNTDLWRQVESPSYRIFCNRKPVYFDGSLYWLVFETNNAIKILSFDCHTEVFRLIPESPLTQKDQRRVTICNLNNRLCVSEKNWPRQEIWSLNTSNVTWEKMYSLNLSSSPPGLLSDETWYVASPITILKNKKLVLFDWSGSQKFVFYDSETRSFSLCCEVDNVMSVAPYFQTLISID